ncbi:MAG: protein kinase family protein [Planctomycetes bacterium]|nr:protein kinase family protein [Planctomycetota bacterium]
MPAAEAAKAEPPPAPEASLMAGAAAFAEYAINLYERAELPDSHARAAVLRDQLRRCAEAFGERAAALPAGEPPDVKMARDSERAVGEILGPLVRDFLGNAAACAEADPLPADAVGEPLPDAEEYCLQLLRDHAAPFPRAALEAVLRTQDLEILELIAESGWCVVFRAYDHALRRRVCVKIPVLAPYQKHALKEARRLQTWAEGSHPAFLKLLRVVNIGPWALFVAEHFRGATIPDEPDGALRDQEEADFIAYQLFDGLVTLHAASLHHGALAPRHLLVGHQAVLKVLDLHTGAAGRLAYDEIASANDSQDLRAATRREVSLRPALPFLAPEVSEGIEGDKVDLFAAGRLLPAIFGVPSPADLPPEVAALSQSLTDVDPARRPDAATGRALFARRLNARNTLFGESAAAAADATLETLLECADDAERVRLDAGLSPAPIHDLAEGRRYAGLADLIAALRAGVAQSLTDPCRVAIIGSRGVGKTTLLSRLALCLDSAPDTPESLALCAGRLAAAAGEKTAGDDPPPLVTWLLPADPEPAATPAPAGDPAGESASAVTLRLPWAFLADLRLAEIRAPTAGPAEHEEVGRALEQCDVVLHVVSPVGFPGAGDDAIARLAAARAGGAPPAIVVNFVDALADRRLDLERDGETVLAAARPFGARVAARVAALADAPPRLLRERRDIWYVSARYGLGVAELAAFVRELAARDVAGGRLIRVAPRLSHLASIFRSHLGDVVNEDLLPRLEAHDRFLDRVDEALDDHLELRVLPRLRAIVADVFDGAAPSLLDAPAGPDHSGGAPAPAPDTRAAADVPAPPPAPVDGAPGAPRRVFDEPDFVVRRLGLAPSLAPAWPDTLAAAIAPLADPASPFWSAVRDETFRVSAQEALFHAFQRTERLIGARRDAAESARRAVAALTGDEVRRQVLAASSEAADALAGVVAEARAALATALHNLRARAGRAAPPPSPSPLPIPPAEGNSRPGDPLEEGESRALLAAPEEGGTEEPPLPPLEPAPDAGPVVAAVEQRFTALEEIRRDAWRRVEELTAEAVRRSAEAMSPVVGEASRRIEELARRAGARPSAFASGLAVAGLLIGLVGAAAAFFLARDSFAPAAVLGGAVALAGVTSFLRARAALHERLEQSAHAVWEAVRQAASAVEPAVAAEAGRFAARLADLARFEERLRDEAVRRRDEVAAAAERCRQAAERAALCAARALLRARVEEWTLAERGRRGELEHAFNRLVDIGENLEAGSLLSCRLAALRARALLRARDLTD